MTLSEQENCGSPAAPPEYRQGSENQFSTARLWTLRMRKLRAQGPFSGPSITLPDTSVHTCGEECGSGRKSCKSGVFALTEVPRARHWKTLGTLLCSPSCRRRME